MEQESERRALDEHELPRTGLVDALTEPRKQHKKPAVLVSQFGKVNVLSSRCVRFLTFTSKKSKETIV